MNASKFSGPFMKKSPIDKKLVGKQNRLPEELKEKILAAPEDSPAKNIDPKLAKKMADKVEQVGRYRDYVEKKEKGYMDEEDGFIKGDPSKTVSFDRFSISEEIGKGGKAGGKAVKHYYANKDKYSGFLDEDKRQAVKKGLNIK